MGEEEKGLQLMAEGERLLRRSSFWAFMDPTKKYEDAREQFTKAAALFKMAKSWENAGKAFERMAAMSEQMDVQHESISSQVDAADMYSRVDKKRAVGLYKAIATKNCELGRFQKAAQMLELGGGLLEEDDVGQAIDCYAKAADYFSSERANSKANKCLEKVAFLSADVGNYGDAAKVFEQLGYSSLESPLLKLGAKKHFLHAGFCLLAKGDVVAAKMALGKYMVADPSLNGTRELTLYEDLCDAYENLESQKFSDALAMYDRIIPLERWETSILLKTKKSIEEAGEEYPDLS